MVRFSQETSELDKLLNMEYIRSRTTLHCTFRVKFLGLGFRASPDFPAELFTVYLIRLFPHLRAGPCLKYAGLLLTVGNKCSISHYVNLLQCLA